MAAEMHVRSVRGLSIAWLEAGDGAPLLLLHGLAADGARSYLPVMEQLPGWRCLAPWARGHSKSGWADSYLIDDYAGDVIALIEDFLDGEPVPLVGFSLGSMVAAYIAIHRPDLIRGIFLEDSPLMLCHDPDRHPTVMSRIFFRSFRDTRRTMISEDRDVDWYAEQLVSFPSGVPGSTETWGDVMPAPLIALIAEGTSSSDPAVVEPVLTLPTAELVAALPPDDLSHIQCPTVILAGEWELGGQLPTDHLARWQELIPHAEIRVVEGTGHGIRTDPNGFPSYMESLLAFLDDVA